MIKARRKNKLKMSKKSLLVVVCLLCIAGNSLAGYSAFMVTSNIVHIDIQYAVTLSYSVSRNHASLTATVTNNGNPVGPRISVEFYYSINSGDWIYFTTESTNNRGVARTRLTLTTPGNYDFRAIVSLL